MSRITIENVDPMNDRAGWFARVFVSRDVFFLWAGQIVSQIGDSMFRIALLWTLLELTGSNVATGLIAMAAYLPSLLFGIYSGAIVDQFDRRRILLLADAARAVIVLTIPLFYFLGGLNGLFLGVATFFLASFNTLFLPARDTLVGRLTEPHQRLAANAMIQTSWMYALLIGPILAGAVLSVAGAIHLFGIDAMTFVVSFLFIYKIKASDRPFRGIKIQEVRESLKAGWVDVKIGVVYVKRSRPLQVLLGITAVDNLFLMGPAIIGSPIYVRQVLNGGPEQYAFLGVASAIGMLVSTFAINRFGHRFRNGHIVLWGIVLDGLTFVPMLWADTFWQMFCALTLHATAIPMIIVARPTIIQNSVPQAMQGRVFSMISVAVFGFTAISIAITGLVAEHVPIQTIYAGAGVLAALTGAIGWLFKDFRSLD